MTTWLAITPEQVAAINALTPPNYKVHAPADVDGALHLPCCVSGADWIPPEAQAIIDGLEPSAPVFPEPEGEEL